MSGLRHPQQGEQGYEPSGHREAAHRVSGMGFLSWYVRHRSCPAIRLRRIKKFTRSIQAKAYIFGQANADSQHIKQPWVADRMSGFPACAVEKANAAKTRIQVTV
jgi:hypothetical protein